MVNFKTRNRAAARFRAQVIRILASCFVGLNLFFFMRGAMHVGSAGDQQPEVERRSAEPQEQAEVRTVFIKAGTQAEERDARKKAAQERLRAGEQGSGNASAAIAAGDPLGGESCHAELDAEYGGEELISWGEFNHKDTPGDCCLDCQAKAPQCNVWVYCNKPEGCTGGRKYQECWLKNLHNLDPLKPRASRSEGLGWVSGAIYTPEQFEFHKKQAEEARNKEQSYIDGLKNNQTLPLVFFDVEIQKKPVGRIEMVLFPHISPRAAENFRQLCTGESGSVPNEPGREGAGRKRHFKGVYFYRIIDQFIDQTGVETESVFGGQFKDDPGGLKLKHDRKGLLSMANMGHDTNTAHFSITMGPAPHLNGDYTIFGQVVSGFDVVDAINALSKGKPDNTATAEAGAQIVDAGQIRKGTVVPDLTLGL